MGNYVSSMGPLRHPGFAFCGAAGNAIWDGMDQLLKIFPNRDWCITGVRFSGDGRGLFAFRQVKVASIGAVFEGHVTNGSTPGRWFLVMRASSRTPAWGDGLADIEPWNGPSNQFANPAGSHDAANVNIELNASNAFSALSMVQMRFARSKWFWCDCTWMDLRNLTTSCNSTSGHPCGSDNIHQMVGNDYCKDARNNEQRMTLGFGGGLIQTLAVAFEDRQGVGAADFRSGTILNLAQLLADANQEAMDGSSGQTKPRLLNDPFFRLGSTFAAISYTTSGAPKFYREVMINNWCRSRSIAGKTPIECWCLNPADANLADTRSTIALDERLLRGMVAKGLYTAGPITCWSVDCKTKGRDATINPNYFISNAQAAAVCPAQPPINVCSVDVSIWQSEGVSVNFPNVTQQCNFTTNNPPPGCLQDPSNPLCKPYVMSQKDNGQACGARTECKSNFCIAGICAPGRENGQSCTSGSDCKSTICQNNVCGSGGASLKPNGSACAAATECLSGVCTGNVCVASGGGKAIGAPCTTASECSSGSCVAGKCAAATLKPNGSTCMVGGECQSGNCIQGTCAAGKPNGAACLLGSECASGACEAKVCVASSLKPNEAPCAAATECASGNCEKGYCAPTFWQKWMWWLIGGGAVLLLLLGLIIWWARSRNSKGEVKTE